MKCFCPFEYRNGEGLRISNGSSRLHNLTIEIDFNV